MSETTISFYPLNPRSNVRSDKIAQIRDFLIAENVNAIVIDSIKVETLGKVQFIDCGTILRHIKCARCGDESEKSKWQDAMSTDFSEDSEGSSWKHPCNVRSANSHPHCTDFVIKNTVDVRLLDCLDRYIIVN